jgi:hypothetical protein
MSKAVDFRLTIADFRLVVIEAFLISNLFQ